MIKFDFKREKKLEFSISVNGRFSGEIKSYFRFYFNDFQIGFPAQISNFEKVIITVPALYNYLKNTPETAKATLEIIQDRDMFLAWSDEVEVNNIEIKASLEKEDEKEKITIVTNLPIKKEEEPQEQEPQEEDSYEEEELEEEPNEEELEYDQEEDEEEEEQTNNIIQGKLDAEDLIKKIRQSTSSFQLEVNNENIKKKNEEIKKGIVSKNIVEQLKKSTDSLIFETDKSVKNRIDKIIQQNNIANKIQEVFKTKD